MPVSKAPLSCGLEVMTKDYEYFTNIAFNMLLVTSTHSFKIQILKALASKAGYATQEAKFESIMQIIKSRLMPLGGM